MSPCMKQLPKSGFQPADYQRVVEVNDGANSSAVFRSGWQVAVIGMNHGQ